MRGFWNAKGGDCNGRRGVHRAATPGCPDNASPCGGQLTNRIRRQPRVARASAAAEEVGTNQFSGVVSIAALKSQGCIGNGPAGCATRQGAMPNVGPFSIERLEVRRYGSLPLCVLNRCSGGCEREIDRDERVNAAALRPCSRSWEAVAVRAGTVLGLASPRVRDSRCQRAGHSGFFGAGGARSSVPDAVNRSTMAMGPPQCGQSHSGRGISAGVESVTVFGSPV